MRHRGHQERGSVNISFLFIGLTLLIASGCLEGPTLSEFLELPASEADRLDGPVRHQLIQEMIQLLGEPAGVGGLRLLEVTIDGRDLLARAPLEGEAETALISIRLNEGLPELMEWIPWGHVSMEEIVLDTGEVPVPRIDEAAMESVDLAVHLEPGEAPWGTEPLKGLSGFSETELLGLLTDMATPYIRTALSRYTTVTEASVSIVRAEGAPFLAAYDQATGEVALNPNYLRLVSLLPPETLAVLSESAGKGLDLFGLCMEYRWQELLMEFTDYFGGNLCDRGGPIVHFVCFIWTGICYILAIVVYISLIPVYMNDCFHFLFECGTSVSSAGGILSLTALSLLPLVLVLHVAGKWKHRSTR